MTEKNKNATNEVHQINAMSHLFVGNVTPDNWYRTIKLESGKPDIVAITILSDILYWYKPRIIRNEDTGETRYERKFKSDLLQRSYAQITEKFGFTEKQARDAMIRLEKLGAAKRVFRSIDTNIAKIHNVMFIEINPMVIKELSEDKETSTHGDLDVNTVLTLKLPPHCLDVNTNTEISTKTTTEINKQKTLAKNDFCPIGFLVENGLTKEEANDWIKIRGKKTCTQSSFNLLLKKYGPMGYDSLADAIRNSIAQGWRGIFPEKQAQSKNKPDWLHPVVDVKEDRPLTPEERAAYDEDVENIDW